MVTPPSAAGWPRHMLERLRRDLAGLLSPAWSGLSVRPGLYAYRVRPPGGTRRLHLRIEADGSGVLWIDVADAIHLNPSAAWLVKMALDGRPLEEAVRLLRARCSAADRRRVRQQAGAIYALVEHVSTTTDACPTCGLSDLGRAEPFGVPVSAPYKADLALTYGCNNACPHCYNPAPRKTMQPLCDADWRRVLRKLAGVGVPHVIFTGGEPTLVPALPDLVARADGLGLVAGLNTNGRRLSDRPLVDRLARSGLSHVQITLESSRPEVHNAMTQADSFEETVEGIGNCVEAGLHAITNTTLTRRNAQHAHELVPFLHRLGLRTMAVNGMIYSGCGCETDDGIPEAQLGPVLVRLRDSAAELGMRLLWYTPTAWCRLSPVELELGPRRCNAGQYSICVEPNGDVLPCQSYYVAAGNLLRDPWEAIWNSPLLRSFRDRVADPRACGLPSECWDCPDLALCGGGCRLEREHI